MQSYTLISGVASRVMYYTIASTRSMPAAATRDARSTLDVCSRTRTELTHIRFLPLLRVVFVCVHVFYRSAHFVFVFTSNSRIL